jgi:acetyl esterase/lipase
MADAAALDGTTGAAAVTRVDDLLFATESGVALYADLYLPRRLDARLVPVIVWVHGGGWRFGDRRLAPNLSRFFAARGFAMASIDYRLSTHALFPAPVRDVKTAVRWLRSVAPTYSLDIDRIGLWGSSSGGHLSALAAVSGAACSRTQTLRTRPSPAPSLRSSTAMVRPIFCKSTRTVRPTARPPTIQSRYWSRPDCAPRWRRRQNPSCSARRSRVVRTAYATPIPRPTRSAERLPH